jgi:hypothetical protein
MKRKMEKGNQGKWPFSFCCPYKRNFQGHYVRLLQIRSQNSGNGMRLFKNTLFQSTNFEPRPHFDAQLLWLSLATRRSVFGQKLSLSKPCQNNYHGFAVIFGGRKK